MSDARSLLPDVGIWAGSICLALGAYLAFGHAYINPQDEGFLWYGVLQTAAGQLPVRDFQSYDPGRYYWCAAGTHIFGEGLVGLRGSLALFQALGLACGLFAARRVVSNGWLLAPIAVAFAIWQQPHFKVFESSFAMIAVLVGTRLIERPDAGRHFALGVLVGIASFFGRNLGLYLLLASFLLALLVSWRGRQTGVWLNLLLLGGGAGAGAAWTWGSMLWEPGFTSALFASVLAIFERGATNLPLPIPWPWRIDFNTGLSIYTLSQLALSISFLLTPLAIAAAGWLGWTGDRERLANRALLGAASVTGLFFLHHAYARADAAHLAQAIHPALLCALALTALPRVRSWQPALVCTGSILLIAFGLLSLNRHPLSTLWKASELVEVEVAGDSLLLGKASATQLKGLLQTSERFGADPIYVVNAPLVYPLVGKTAPSHALFVTWELSKQEQERIVADLEDALVSWILVADVAFDGRNELRFEHTHAIVLAWMQQRFELVEDSELAPPYRLWQRR